MIYIIVINYLPVIWYIYINNNFFSYIATYNIGYQYIVSLYWALATTTTVGYGDIHAHTDSEVGSQSTATTVTLARTLHARTSHAALNYLTFIDRICTSNFTSAFGSQLFSFLLAICCMYMYGV